MMMINTTAETRIKWRTEMGGRLRDYISGILLVPKRIQRLGMGLLSEIRAPSIVVRAFMLQ